MGATVGRSDDGDIKTASPGGGAAPNSDQTVITRSEIEVHQHFSHWVEETELGEFSIEAGVPTIHHAATDKKAGSLVG